MSDVANLPAKIAEMRTGGSIKPVVPQSMDDAYRLAKAVCISGLAPRGLEKPEAAMVAILHGLEIGLTPMMALQKIAVINGRPTIWGDGALGLVRSSGLCKYVKEWIEGKDDGRVAHCETLRSGEVTSIKRSFSVADAKRAGLWGKQGPWQSFPERMLQMRARAFALRDGYADVLGGMYLAEELQGSEPAPPTAPTAPQPAVLAPPAAPKRQRAQGAPRQAPKAPAPEFDEAAEREADRMTRAAMAGAPTDEQDEYEDYLDMMAGELEEAADADAVASIEETCRSTVDGWLERSEIDQDRARALLKRWLEHVSTANDRVKG